MSLKIPPPVQFAFCLLLMFLVDRLLPVGSFMPSFAPLALLLIFGGIALNIYSVIVFRRSGTTIDPRKPDASTSLVQDWPFSISRNPIYVALTCVLLGATLLFGNVFNFLTVAAFVWYITEYQIKPEEEALKALFGKEYAEYQSRVRRWL